MPFLSLAVALLDGRLQFLSLEFQHVGLSRIDRPLLVELPTLQVKLVRLHLEQLALLPGQLLLVPRLSLQGTDLLGLLTECLDREDGGNDCADEQPPRWDITPVREAHGRSLRPGTTTPGDHALCHVVPKPGDGRMAEDPLTRTGRGTVRRSGPTEGDGSARSASLGPVQPPGNRLRATRASPPGLACDDHDRRAIYGAALQQFDDLIAAAGAIGPVSRPLPLYYAVHQAGKAIVAAWVRDEFRPRIHGLT